MKNLKLKPIGLRNVKTSIAVLICILLLSKSAIFAAVAAVICMQDTIENSVKIGKTRLIGTLIGGVLGVILLSLTHYLNLDNFLPLITALGVTISIYMCNIIDRPTASAITSLVVISIMLAPVDKDPILYACDRTIETALGIIVAILVNKYLDPSFLHKKN